MAIVLAAIPATSRVTRETCIGASISIIPAAAARSSAPGSAGRPVMIVGLMRRILVTNDDGYFSPGVQALAAVFAPLGDVTVVAPHIEASAVGHALTLRRPLRLDKIADRVYSVDGTPTDCINIAIDEVLQGPPDLVVSGINKGLNVGDDVTYSGTVAGALEGALPGQQAVAG